MIPLIRAARFGMAFYHLFVLRDRLFDLILIVWVRQKGVAGHEYARPNIGASITGENSGNGALLIRESEQSENKSNGTNEFLEFTLRAFTNRFGRAGGLRESLIHCYTLRSKRFTVS
jgi:hypothetical protein